MSLERLALEFWDIARMARLSKSPALRVGLDLLLKICHHDRLKNRILELRAESGWE